MATTLYELVILFDGEINRIVSSGNQTMRRIIEATKVYRQVRKRTKIIIGSRDFITAKDIVDFCMAIDTIRAFTNTKIETIKSSYHKGFDDNWGIGLIHLNGLDWPRIDIDIRAPYNGDIEIKMSYQIDHYNDKSRETMRTRTITLKFIEKYAKVEHDTPLISQKVDSYIRGNLYAILVDYMQTCMELALNELYDRLLIQKVWKHG